MQSEEVRLSHLTFWGHRGELIVPLKFLLPVSDTRENAAAFAFKIYIEDDAGNEKDFIICTRFGGVQDRELFRGLFGREIEQGLKDEKDK